MILTAPYSTPTLKAAKRYFRTLEYLYKLMRKLVLAIFSPFQRECFLPARSQAGYPHGCPQGYPSSLWIAPSALQTVSGLCVRGPEGEGEVRLFSRLLGLRREP